MSNIQKLESGIQLKQSLPHSDEIIRMDYLEGWDDLSEPKKAYLCSYFETYPKKIKACINAGIPRSAYQKWKNDKRFKKLMGVIEQIHTEELEHLEYIESYTDSKVRGRYLKNKKKSRPAPRTKIDIDMRGTESAGSFSKLEEVMEEAEIIDEQNSGES